MSERTMKPVLSTDSKGLTFVRPSQLAKDGVTGVVASGIYLGKVENKFDADKSDYKVDGEDSLYILNAAGSLDKQMSMITEGQYIEVHYNGKQEIATGKLAGKSVHNFQVLVEQD